MSASAQQISEAGRAYPTVFREFQEEIAALRIERSALKAFKEGVHKYLDDHGVPHHPPGTHGAAGCRIGDRMDWLMARIVKAETEGATV